MYHKNNPPAVHHDYCCAPTLFPGLRLLMQGSPDDDARLSCMWSVCTITLLTTVAGQAYS